MLDLIKIARQMQGISAHLSQEATAAQRRIEIAQRLMGQALPRQAELTTHLAEAGASLGFAAATPIEPLDLRGRVDAAPDAHTVIATDGSQISPSHHEIAYCYLLNTGRVVLHYGQSRFPQLDSLPEVIYRSEDLYAARQWGISTEEWMGHRRTMSEATVLVELVAEHQTSTVPTLALTDGSLIYWFLESLPVAAQEVILEPILAAWNQLQALRSPLVGYLSASRSSEGLNFLRLAACPYPTPDCQRHCPGQTDGAPCQVFSPLRDVAYWATALEPGQRSPLWRSSADILRRYGDHQVYFCYLHVGPEVARLEMPQWVVEDPDLFDMALRLTLTQVQKGYGYPVALAEAHNQAVVRGGDRTRFFALLEREMIRAGLKNVGTSYKEARKRGSIA
ncbi:nuclease [filamentous cyanobacterium CCP5]|nr:nuclease [filamentous cyanobacterium CCP5]